MSSNLSYPLNPDTSFESFTLTDEAAVKAAFGGKTYSVANLVPMNYSKILAACKAGILTYAPLREYCYSGGTLTENTINNETGNNQQSISLRFALLQLLSYWESDILAVAPFQCPLGVVTEIKSDLNGLVYYPVTEEFFTAVKTIIKVNWFVIPGSLYS